MLKPLRRRAAALLLCAGVLLGLCPPVRGAQGPEEMPVEKPDMILYTADDLLQLGRNCALDSWSRGRTVRLAADLDLTGLDFTPIPSFGGVLEGQGHTISGLNLTQSGSSMGLFRFVQEGAVVRDLTVTGTVHPGGSASQVGGIAGDNRGAIVGCAFLGTVRGESRVGGIVGLNRESGQISACQVSGQVTGTSATGGVAGENRGVVLQCGNAAQVNTVSPDSTLSLQDLTAGAASLSLSEEEDPLSGHSDTGGIVGLSSGVVQSCVNTGPVGYPHVGYNVGGIAGRQDGYLAGCTNTGAICGRKDVGGIVGQAEPDVIIRPGFEVLDDLRQELDTLDELINRTLDDTDLQGERISRRLTAIGGCTDRLRNYADTLMEQTVDFADGNMEQINTLSARFSAALDLLSPALDELEGAAGQVDDLCTHLEVALDALAQAGDIAGDVSIEAQSALDQLEQAGQDLGRASRDLKNAVDMLQNAVVHKDPDGEKQALEDLAGALSDLGSAFSQASDAAATLLDCLQEGLPLEDEDIEALTDALADMGDAAKRAGDNLKTLSEDIDIDTDALRAAADWLSSAFDDLRRASNRFSSAMDALKNAADWAGALDRPLGDASDALRQAMDILSSMGEQLSRSFDQMGQASDALRQDGPIQLLPLGDDFRAAGDGLYAAATDLSGELKSLQTLMDSARGELLDDLRAVQQQLRVILDLLLDAVDEVKDGVESPELSVDHSDVDIEGTRLGKVTRCVNTGPVSGDRSVGGIAGAMSIESDLDPEEDLEQFTLGSTFETRAVLLENINWGEITAKKDCAGGLVGRMDLGTAAACENYGGVESTGGSFVGGVAGWSRGILRSSFAKCVLSGKGDVGGIAGWACAMYDCQAIADITSGDERLGAIAGDADLSGGQIAGNRFVDTGWAGIDGVSYEGLAQPVEYGLVCTEEGVPSEFITFQLTLRTDTEVVDSLPLEYGQSLEGLSLPPVPEREGYYGRWPDFERSTVVTDITLEAVYTPWAALVASQETSQAGLALALVEGQFTEEAHLQVLPSSQQRPPEGEDGTVWEVTLTGTDLPNGTQIPLRLLDQVGDSRVWQLKNGQWQEVEAVVNGQYLLLTMDGLSALYCIAPKPGLGWLPFVLVGALAAVVCIVLLLRRNRKRRRAKAKAK